MKFKLSKSKIFLISNVVFIIGIAIASFLFESEVGKPHFQNGLWLFVGVVLFLVLTILFWRKILLSWERVAARSCSNNIYFIFYILFILSLALWRYSVSLPSNTPDKIWHYNNQEIIFKGAIDKEPDVRAKNIKYELEVQNNISGKVLVTTNLYPKYNYGDVLEIKCFLKQPEKFNGFAYDRYLARFNVYSVCYYPKIKLLNKNNGNIFYKNIFLLKHKLQEKINLNLKEPEASLANAIILGIKKNIPPDLRDVFSKIGISHIVAISGLHISILSGLVMGLLSQLGLSRKKSFVIASLFLLVYIILIGLPASAIRAGIMGFLFLLALNIGRLNKLINSLALAGVILLLINPRLLRDDIGFQLSFLAVLGIAIVFPIINNFYRDIKNKILKIIFNIFNVTISAQVFTWPLLAINFSSVSLIAPVSNLLILWTLPLLIVSALIALLISFIFPALAIIFFLPVQILIKYLIFISNYLAKIPYASIELNYFWIGWFIIYYLVIIFFILRIKKLALR